LRVCVCVCVCVCVNMYVCVLPAKGQAEMVSTQSEAIWVNGKMYHGFQQRDKEAFVVLDESIACSSQQGRTSNSIASNLIAGSS